jgi:hypothetical protein
MLSHGTTARLHPQVPGVHRWEKFARDASCPGNGASGGSTDTISFPADVEDEAQGLFGAPHMG